MTHVPISSWIEQTLGISPGTQWNVLLTFVVVSALWIGRRILLRTIERHVEDVHARYRWRKSTAYGMTFVVLVALVRIWFQGFSSLSTMLGLISAGVAIALKDPLVNLVGWLFIMWRQPFSVGDRIEVGAPGTGVTGDVIDQRVFSFTLMEIGNWVHADQSTGRIIHVPNGRVFTDSIANYTRGFRYIWDEIAVLVTFESNWRKAKRLLTDIVNEQATHPTGEAERRLREASRQFMIFYSKLTPIVYTSVEESGIMLTLRYLTEPQKRRGRREKLWEAILDAFEHCDDIDFAYPTRRMYLNTREGKKGTIKAPTEDRDTVTTRPDSDGFF